MRDTLLKHVQPILLTYSKYTKTVPEYGGTSKPRQRKVTFADNKQSPGSKCTFLNICHFDKDEEPINCNPHTKERERVTGILSRSDEDGLGFNLVYQCMYQESKCLDAQLVAHDSTIDKKSASIDRVESIPSVKKNNSRCPEPKAYPPFTVLVAHPDNSAKLLASALGIPTTNFNSKVRRMVRSLWLTFNLKAEEEPVDMGMVRLATAQYDERTRFLSGKICVHNVEYGKDVFVRYTIDNWRNWRDIPARYESTSSTLEYDIFAFSILVSINIPHGHKIAFAVCYRVAGREYWDNNHGVNYEARVVLSVSSPVIEQKKRKVDRGSLEAAMNTVNSSVRQLGYEFKLDHLSENSRLQNASKQFYCPPTMMMSSIIPT